MIGYATIGANDLERSTTFYSSLAGQLRPGPPPAAAPVPASPPPPLVSEAAPLPPAPDFGPASVEPSVAPVETLASPTPEDPNT